MNILNTPLKSQTKISKKVTIVSNSIESSTFISTLTKDEMLNTLRHIAISLTCENVVVAAGKIKEIRPNCNFKHNDIIYPLIKDELQSAEDYMLPIEEYVNNCIKKKQNINIIAKFLSFAYNSILHLFNGYEINSTKFVENINSYDYGSIDAIGRLYIKIVLASLYNKLKHPTSTFDYDKTDTKYDITDKLHKSIQNIFESPESITKHKELYYNKSKKFTEDIYHLDLLISENKHKLSRYIKFINKHYTQLDDTLLKVYPIFDDLNLFLDYYENGFLEYYEGRFLLKPKGSYTQMLKYTIATLVFGLSLLYIFVPITLIFSLFEKVMAGLTIFDEKALGNLDELSKTNIFRILINELLELVKTYLPMDASTLYESLFNNYLKVIKNFNEFILNYFKGLSTGKIHLVLKWLTILSGTIFGWLIHYIASPAKTSPHSVKILRSYSSTYLNVLNEMQKLYEVYARTHSITDLSKLYRYYMDNIVNVEKNNLLVGYTIQLKYDPNIIDLNKKISEYEESRFNLLIKTISKK